VIALLGSVFATSLLGSLHCAGMCGGFVCVYSGGSGGGRRLLPHVAYNGGRLVSYLLLGVLAGTIGAGLDQLGALAGLARLAAVVAGALMIVWGGMALLRAAGIRIPEPAAPGFLRARFAGALRAVHAQPPALRALTLGLVTTLLPCGFLYAYVTIAAGTGSAPGGMLVMAAFWAGTVPVMAGLGAAAGRALQPFQRRVPEFTAAALLVIGLLTVTGKFVPHPGHMHHDMPGMTHGGR
jgi:sulfite exporter TauE/SafE